MAATYVEVTQTMTIAVTAATAINIQTGVGGGPADVDGDVVTLPANASAFNDDAMVEVYMNGNRLHKGVDVFWVSTTQLSLACPLRIGGKLTIARITI